MSNQGSYKIFKLWKKKKASNNSHEAMTETIGEKKTLQVRRLITSVT
jgi:hypothetical protein